MRLNRFCECFDILPGLVHDLVVLLLLPYSNIDWLEHYRDLLSLFTDLSLDEVWIGLIQPLVDTIKLPRHVGVLLWRDVVLIDCGELLLDGIYVPLQFVLIFVSLFSRPVVSLHPSLFLRQLLQLLG